LAHTVFRSLSILFVMAGLAPAMHGLILSARQGVDDRHKAGHDRIEAKKVVDVRTKRGMTGQIRPVIRSTRAVI
jgi:hypothetical protein